MNWFKWIGDAIVTAIRTRDRLYVRIKPCPCGSVGARLDKNRYNEWYVYCPYGCRERGTPANTRRQAKLNWNEER